MSDRTAFIQTPSPLLDIQLFRGLRLRWLGQTLPPFSTEKARSLFAFLAFYCHQQHHRGKLAGLLWPDLADQKARRHLTQELWRIRSHLRAHTGHAYISTHGDVCLDPQMPWAVDVDCFLKEVGKEADHASLARAVERYAGDLLVDLDDAWILPERDFGCSRQPAPGRACRRTGSPGGRGRVGHLWDALAEDATWRGAQVFRAAAADVEENPFGVLIQTLAPYLTPLHIQQLALILDPLWLGVLARLFPQIGKTLEDMPEPPPLEPQADEQRTQEALLRLVRALEPAVLLLDDLHRADLESLETLQVFARRLGRSSVLVVAAYRDEIKQTDPARWAALRAVDQMGVRTKIMLQPLDEQATTELIRLALGMSRAAPRFAARIHAATGGIPFFILESLRTLYENGLLFPAPEGEWATPWDNQTGEYSELVLPARVEALLEQRVRSLSSESQTLLAQAAVLGAAFTLPALQAMSGLDGPILLRSIRELVAQHFLVETETHLRFYHDLVRETVYQNLPMSQARAMHDQAGQALLAQADVHPALLAHHFTLGENWPQALRYHWQAAQKALARSAFHRAREHLDAALDAFGRILELSAVLTPEERVELLLQYEHTLDVLGDRERQAEMLDQLAALTAEHPSQFVQVLCRKAAFLTLMSRYDESAVTARQAQKEAQRLQDEDGVVRALIVLGRNEDQRGAPQQAVPLLESE